MQNISIVANSITARTCIECAEKRAENLFLLGAKNVLELCVGPSLPILEKTYNKFEINVTGNDIENRWKQNYPKGKWVIGDALKIDYSKYDAVVFAPPLSKGCTGKREDSLSISNVNPAYDKFLSRIKDINGIAVLVLPGRSLSTSFDREQFYNLRSKINKQIEIVPLKAGNSKKIVKYYDVYINCK